MRKGRIAATGVAVVTVAGCAAVAIGMATAAADRQHRAELRQTAADRLAAAAARSTASSIPAQLPGASTSSASATPSHRPAPRTRTHTSTSAAPSSSSVAPAPSTPAPVATTPAAAASSSPVQRATTHATRSSAFQPSTATSTHGAPAPTTHPTVHHTTAPAVHATAPRRGVRLPLRMSTGSATRVITVVASSASRTTAWLQPWTKAPGGGWLRWGSRITAHLGSEGMSWSPSESRSATPMGSFSLTRAFGHDSDPGTPLPYVHTDPSYWWISQAGRLYNTMQHCSSGCPFNQGAPNEHLYYETPYYNYAVVIDYNTRNTGHVRQGAGSAFFLHVTDGAPTAGCVAIPQWRLVQIMRWLSPSAHPRMLIGVA